MAWITVFLQILCLIVSFSATSQCCNVDQCKLLPSAPEVASEFQSLASEKGVRIVYIYLKVGDNSSYNPLDQKNVFFPGRWVWSNSISEPMLSMEYNYDIFSVSLLNNQARSISVHLIEEPSGCLADLNSSCQNSVIGKVLLEKVTLKGSDKALQGRDVVCVALIEKEENSLAQLEGNIKYHCCAAEKRETNASEPLPNCDLSVKKSDGYMAIDVVLLIAALIVALYCPAFVFALPEAIVMNIADETEREEVYVNQSHEPQTIQRLDSNFRTQSSDSETTDRQDDAPSAGPVGQEKIDSVSIPVDNASPITCSVLLQNCTNRFPGFQLSFNVKLVFLSYFIVPAFLYIFLLLNLTLKGDFFKECYRKDKAYLGGIVFYIVYLLRVDHAFITITIFALSPFIIMVSLKPTDLTEDYKIVYPGLGRRAYKRTVGQRIRQNLSIMQDKLHEVFSSSSQLYLNGLEKFIDFTIRKFLRKTKYPGTSRIRRLLCVLCVLILSLLGFLFAIVLGGILSTLFLMRTYLVFVSHSPSACVLGFLWGKLGNQMYLHAKCPPTNVCAIFVTFLLLAVSNFALITACGVVGTSCFLLIKTFGYTLMGLILNADIATPYAVFLLVVVTNVYLCYANLQNRYKEAKQIISKQWQQNKDLLQLEDQRHLVNKSDGTIPKKLFWFVCGEDLNAEYTILPIQTELFFMLRNMICVLLFLFLSLSTVIFFTDLYQLSTVASSIAVFISGVIPKLFLQGFTKKTTLDGWEKIRISRQIEEAVKTYIEYVNNGETPAGLPEDLALRNIAIVSIVPQE